MIDSCINGGWIEAWMNKQTDEINKGESKKLAWTLEINPS